MYISTIKPIVLIHSFTVWPANCLPSTFSRRFSSGHPGGDRPGGLPQRQAGARLVHGASSALGLSGREGHPGAMLGLTILINHMINGKFHD